MKVEKNVEAFNEDVESNQGYLYSQTDKLSCRLSNGRISQAAREFIDLSNKTVLDVGCGDGIFTKELLAQNPRSVLGVDAAAAAVAMASQNASSFSNMRFQVCNVYDLPALNQNFDIAIVRGVLHHLDDAPAAVRSICSVARIVVVIEPNGYNPVLKIIEKCSSYHRQHDEKSYSPEALNRWFADCGATLERSSYIGLVPMFCPDWMARGLKSVETFVEKVPGLRAICCGQYIMKVTLVK